MKITISAIGKVPSKSPENQLINEYVKRVHWEIKLNEIELKKNLEGDKLKEVEGDLLLASVVSNSKIILLEEAGEMMDSKEFAKFLQKSQLNGDKLSFMLGGAFGHGEKLRSKSNKIISLSPMTFPHILARILLVEQIYRAYTIINNHPYHK